MAQLMPLPLTVSCSSKIQIGFTFLVPAHPGSPGQGAVKRVCVPKAVELDPVGPYCWQALVLCLGRPQVTGESGPLETLLNHCQVHSDKNKTQRHDYLMHQLISDYSLLILKLTLTINQKFCRILYKLEVDGKPVQECLHLGDHIKQK